MGSEKYHKLFGLLEIRKIYTPFIMMALIQITIPDADFTGHLTGMISAYLLRNLAFSLIFLPRFYCIYLIENKLNCLIEIL